MPNDKVRALLYRTITALGVILAFSITLIIPQHMRENSDWSFQYAVQNFSQGRFTVDGITIGHQADEANQYGGLLSQYVLLGDDRWALTEAPGYIFYLLPFYYIHATEIGNLVLAAGMTAVAYLLLRRLRDEKTACLGSLLLLFTPVALAMMQRAYSDSFGASAFLAMGGGLYLYYCLRRRELTAILAGILLFLSGLSLGWSLAANYNNSLPVVIFTLHFIFTFFRSRLPGQGREPILPAVLMVVGIAIPLAGLLVYQNAVFGSPLKTGLQYVQLPVGFALQCVWLNFKFVTVALLVGFPLLLPAMATLFSAFYSKIRACASRRSTVPFIDILPEVSLDVLLLFGGWIASVYGLYFAYEWTANTQVVSMPFVMMAKFYLPAAFPLTVLATLLLKRLPQKLVFSLIALSFVWGILFFIQSGMSYPVVPPHNPYNPMAVPMPDSNSGLRAFLV
jgi:hypothetical protein